MFDVKEGQRDGARVRGKAALSWLSYSAQRVSTAGDRPRHNVCRNTGNSNRLEIV